MKTENSLKQELENLQKTWEEKVIFRLESQKFNPQDFKECAQVLRKMWAQLAKIASKYVDSKPYEDEETRELRREIIGDLGYLSDLQDKLRNKGKEHAQQFSGISKSIEDQGFRLMELARLGKREEVFSQLLRIYWAEARRQKQANAEKIPVFDSILIEPFALNLPKEIFTNLILSYLSGAMEEVFKVPKHEEEQQS